MRRSARDLLRRLLVRLLNKLPDGVVLAIREDVSLRRRLDYPRAELHLEIDSSEEYHVRLRSCIKEPETITWIETNLQPGDVFYDIGANVGAYALVAAAYGGPSVRVYAFEPNSATFAKLSRNIAINDLHGRVTPLPIALSAESGFASFRYASDRPGLASHSDVNFGAGPPYRLAGGAVQTVITAPLDAVVRQYGLPDPTLIKIDVDGGERDVLVGARDVLLRSSVRAILLEVDDAPSKAQPVFAILEAAGFELAGSVRHPAVVNHMFVRAGAAGQRRETQRDLR